MGGPGGVGVGTGPLCGCHRTGGCLRPAGPPSASGGCVRPYHDPVLVSTKVAHLGARGAVRVSVPQGAHTHTLADTHAPLAPTTALPPVHAPPPLPHRQTHRSPVPHGSPPPPNTGALPPQAALSRPLVSQPQVEGDHRVSAGPSAGDGVPDAAACAALRVWRGGEHRLRADASSQNRSRGVHEFCTQSDPPQPAIWVKSPPPSCRRVPGGDLTLIAGWGGSLCVKKFMR